MAQQINVEDDKNKEIKLDDLLSYRCLKDLKVPFLLHFDHWQLFFLLYHHSLFHFPFCKRSKPYLYLLHLR